MLDGNTTGIAGATKVAYHEQGDPYAAVTMIKTSRTLFVLGAIALMAGCAGRSDAPSPFDERRVGGAAASEDPIRIEVQNLNFNDATIWAMRGSQRIRLGRVTGKTDQTFRITWNVAVPISFSIDITGGRSCRSGQLGVEPEAVVLLTIPGNVGQQPCRIGRR